MKTLGLVLAIIGFTAWSIGFFLSLDFQCSLMANKSYWDITNGERMQYWQLWLPGIVVAYIGMLIYEAKK